MSRSLSGGPAVCTALLAAALAGPAALDAQTRGELEPRVIAARTGPAVVAITALDAGGKPVAQGTGFLVGADGTLVTNFHVIERAASLSVETYEGARHREVMVVGVDPERDVAVLQVPARTPRFLPLGPDTELEVGDRVYVMGNPLGMERTFSDGLLSARRTADGMTMLQVSAPISQGSSGGPVMDAAGRVVGVATATMAEGQNLNLATPVRYVRPLLARRPAAPPRFSAALIAHQATPPLRPAGPRRNAAGEDRWLAQARGQVDGAVRLLARQGFAPAVEVQTGYGQMGSPGLLRVRLEAGRQYGAMGACDIDCSDLDLVVLDRDRAVLGSDAANDDRPVVIFTAPYTGEYFIGVAMARCATEVCGYAVGVVTR